jgi:hypothetical protein
VKSHLGCQGSGWGKAQARRRRRQTLHSIYCTNTTETAAHQRFFDRHHAQDIVIKHLIMHDHSEMAETTKDGKKFFLPPEIWQRVFFQHSSQVTMD